MKITNTTITTTVTRIDFTLDDIVKSVNEFNRDMLFEMLVTHLGRRSNRHETFSRDEMLNFASVIFDETKRNELSEETGVPLIDVPTTMGEWRKVIVEHPGLFIPYEETDGKTKDTLIVTLDGVGLDVEEILQNV